MNSPKFRMRRVRQVVTLGSSATGFVAPSTCGKPSRFRMARLSFSHSAFVSGSQIIWAAADISPCRNYSEGWWSHGVSGFQFHRIWGFIVLYTTVFTGSLGQWGFSAFAPMVRLGFCKVYVGLIGSCIHAMGTRSV